MAHAFGGQDPLPGTVDRLPFDPGPEGPSDTNGGDRINAHVSGRFLRALSCPAAIIAAVTPLIPLVAGLLALVAGGPC